MKCRFMRLRSIGVRTSALKSHWLCSASGTASPVWEVQCQNHLLFLALCLADIQILAGTGSGNTLSWFFLLVALQMTMEQLFLNIAFMELPPSKVVLTMKFSQKKNKKKKSTQTQIQTHWDIHTHTYTHTHTHTFPYLFLKLVFVKERTETVACDYT